LPESGEVSAVRLIDKHIDFGFVRELLKDGKSETGRPSIDPELLLRILLIRYLCITSERLFRHTEIIDAAGRASSRRAGPMAASHHRLLTSSLKERILPWLQIGLERDLVGPDRHMLGLKQNLFVLLNTRLAGGHAAERTYLKFTAIAFLLQPDEYIVGSANPIRHIKVKLRLPVLHAIL
jgi:hypothetical protein